MNTKIIIECVGYLGSLLVLISFLMTSVFKLRIVNAVGGTIFMIYALIIQSYPTAIMNFCLVLINIRFLWKMRNTGHEYDLVEVDGGDEYLQYILKRQESDIKKYFSGIDIFSKENRKALNRCYIITCQANPAGITMGEEKSDEFRLALDYSFPEYRDFSIGKFLFDNLKSSGISRIIYDGPAENHMAYLEKMGFVRKGDAYIKEC